MTGEELAGSMSELRGTGVVLLALGLVALLVVLRDRARERHSAQELASHFDAVLHAPDEPETVGEHRGTSSTRYVSSSEHDAATLDALSALTAHRITQGVRNGHVSVRARFFPHARPFDWSTDDDDLA